MIKPRLKSVLARPESKSWVRVVDASMVLFATAGIANIYFVLPIEFDIRLLDYASIGGLVCTPVVALTLYRVNDISRSERIAILGIVLTAVIALLVAALEASKNGGA